MFTSIILFAWTVRWYVVIKSLKTVSFNSSHWIETNTSIVYKYELHILVTSECSDDKHCSGVSDKCTSNVCFCGTKKKCSGTSDTCTDGNCTCGGNSECSSEKVCYPGGKCINGEKV